MTLPKLKHLRTHKGDTLIEVVLSIAILSVTLTTAYNVANMTFRLGVAAREQTQAANLAQDQAEQLYAYREQAGFATASTGCGASPCHMNGAAVPVIGPTTGCNFMPEGCQTLIDWSVNSGLWVADVTVRWDSNVSDAEQSQVRYQIRMADIKNVPRIECFPSWSNPLCH